MLLGKRNQLYKNKTNSLEELDVDFEAAYGLSTDTSALNPPKDETLQKTIGGAWQGFQIAGLPGAIAGGAAGIVSANKTYDTQMDQYLQGVERNKAMMSYGKTVPVQNDPNKTIYSEPNPIDYEDSIPQYLDTKHGLDINTDVDAPYTTFNALRTGIDKAEHGLNVARESFVRARMEYTGKKKSKDGIEVLDDKDDKDDKDGKDDKIKFADTEYNKAWKEGTLTTYDPIKDEYYAKDLPEVTVEATPLLAPGQVPPEQVPNFPEGFLEEGYQHLGDPTQAMFTADENPYPLHSSFEQTRERGKKKNQFIKFFKDNPDQFIFDSTEGRENLKNAAEEFPELGREVVVESFLNNYAQQSMQLPEAIWTWELRPSAEDYKKGRNWRGRMEKAAESVSYILGGEMFGGLVNYFGNQAARGILLTEEYLTGKLPGKTEFFNKIFNRNWTTQSQKENFKELIKFNDEMSAYGYELASKEELKQMAKDPIKGKGRTKGTKSADEYVKGLVDQHNTVVRGVATDIEMMELQGAIDQKDAYLALAKELKLDPVKDQVKIAMHMGTHTAGRGTGGGKAPPVSIAGQGNLFGVTRGGWGPFQKPIQEGKITPLYTSNSPTQGTAYTYGGGYNVRAKLPTTYDPKQTYSEWFQVNQPLLHGSKEYTQALGNEFPLIKKYHEFNRIANNSGLNAEVRQQTDVVGKGDWVGRDRWGWGMNFSRNTKSEPFGYADMIKRFSSKYNQVNNEKLLKSGIGPGGEFGWPGREMFREGNSIIGLGDTGVNLSVTQKVKDTNVGVGMFDIVSKGLDRHMVASDELILWGLGGENLLAQRAKLEAERIKYGLEKSVGWIDDVIVREKWPHVHMTEGMARVNNAVNKNIGYLSSYGGKYKVYNPGDVEKFYGTEFNFLSNKNFPLLDSKGNVVSTVSDRGIGWEFKQIGKPEKESIKHELIKVVEGEKNFMLPSISEKNNLYQHSNRGQIAEWVPTGVQHTIKTGGSGRAGTSTGEVTIEYGFAHTREKDLINSMTQNAYKNGVDDVYFKSANDFQPKFFGVENRNGKDVIMMGFNGDAPAIPTESFVKYYSNPKNLEPFRAQFIEENLKRLQFSSGKSSMSKKEISAIKADLNKNFDYLGKYYSDLNKQNIVTKQLDESPLALMSNAKIGGERYEGGRREAREWRRGGNKVSSSLPMNEYPLISNHGDIAQHYNIGQSQNRITSVVRNEEMAKDLPNEFRSLLGGNSSNISKPPKTKAYNDLKNRVDANVLREYAPPNTTAMGEGGEFLTESIYSPIKLSGKEGKLVEKWSVDFIAKNKNSLKPDTKSFNEYLWIEHLGKIDHKKYDFEVILKELDSQYGYAEVAREYDNYLRNQIIQAQEVGLKSSSQTTGILKNWTGDINTLVPKRGMFPGISEAGQPLQGNALQHYIFMGKPGEKVLEPVSARQVGRTGYEKAVSTQSGTGRQHGGVKAGEKGVTRVHKHGGIIKAENGLDNSLIDPPNYTYEWDDAVHSGSDKPTTLEFTGNERERAEKMYKRISPSGYGDVSNMVRYFTGQERTSKVDSRSEELFQNYLGINDNPNYLTPSQTKPSISTDPNATYYRMDDDFEQSVLDYVGRRGSSMKDKTSEFIGEFDLPTKWDPLFNKDIEQAGGYNPWSALGNFKIGKGTDEKGEYISYYDKYDLPDWIHNRLKGKDYEIYNRVYLPEKEDLWDKYDREKKESEKINSSKVKEKKHGGTVSLAQCYRDFMKAKKQYKN